MGYDNNNATSSPLFVLPPRLIERKNRLSHPVIYDDALPEAKFYCLLSKQLRICGYREFGFRDLACPHPKRLRRQLSALINFLKYREDMGHLEMQALDEVSLLVAARNVDDGWWIFGVFLSRLPLPNSLSRTNVTCPITTSFPR
jgi:hypothetical protein